MNEGMTRVGRGSAAGTSSTPQAGRTRLTGFRVLLCRFMCTFLLLYRSDAAGFNFSSTRETTGGMAAAGGRSNISRHQDTGGSSRFDFFFLPHFTFLTRIGQFTCSSFIIT